MIFNLTIVEVMIHCRIEWIRIRYISYFLRDFRIICQKPLGLVRYCHRLIKTSVSGLISFRRTLY